MLLDTNLPQKNANTSRLSTLLKQNDGYDLSLGSRIGGLTSDIRRNSLGHTIRDVRGQMRLELDTLAGGALAGCIILV